MAKPSVLNREGLPGFDGAGSPWQLGTSLHINASKCVATVLQRLPPKWADINGVLVQGSQPGVWTPLFLEV